MMINNDWMSEDYLSIYDMIVMLGKFKGEYDNLRTMYDRDTKQAGYKVETLVETILQLQEEIRTLKGEPQ